MKNSKIYKVAGLSLLGFVAVSIGVDKANVGPMLSQAAGFCGAFAGALAAQVRTRKDKAQTPDSEGKPSEAKPSEVKPPAVKPPAVKLDDAPDL